MKIKTMRNLKIIKKLLITFISWRLFLFLIAFLAKFLFPLRKGFLGGGDEFYFKLPWIYGWANFDGVHYLSIAKRSYAQYEQAFFPLYPLLIRFFARFLGTNFNSYFLVGFFLSNICFLFSLYFFYQLVLNNFGKKIAQNSLIFLLLFPT